MSAMARNQATKFAERVSNGTALALFASIVHDQYSGNNKLSIGPLLADFYTAFEIPGAVAVPGDRYALANATVLVVANATLFAAPPSTSV